MTQSSRYKEAMALRSAGGNAPTVYPLSDGSFAVFDRGSVLFGIVEKLHPTFIRACCSSMQKDFVTSDIKIARFRLREGANIVKETGPKKLSELELEL